MSEFWQNIFYALVAETLVVLLAMLVKEDKRRLLVLTFGTAIAGAIGFGSLIFQNLSTSISITPTPSSLSLHDSFNDSTYDGQYDKRLWFCERCGPQGSGAFQQNDSLRFEVFSEGAVTSVEFKSRSVWRTDEIAYLEGRLRFDESAESGGVWLAAGEANCFLRVAEITSKRLVFQCGFVREPETSGQAEWKYSTDEIMVDFGRWYTMRTTFNHETGRIFYYLDGNQIGEFIPDNPNSVVEVRFGAWTETTSTVAYVDEVTLKTEP